MSSRVQHGKGNTPVSSQTVLLLRSGRWFSFAGWVSDRRPTALAGATTHQPSARFGTGRRRQADPRGGCARDRRALSRSLSRQHVPTDTYGSRRRPGVGRKRDVTWVDVPRAPTSAHGFKRDSSVS